MFPRNRSFVALFAAVVVTLLVVGVFVLSRWSDEAKSPDVSNKTSQQGSNSFDKSKRSTSDPSSIWVVVNKSRPLNPREYAPTDLVDFQGQRMRKEALTALQQIFGAAASEGLQLQALSGYRSYETQQYVYNREVAAFGQEVADSQSAKPGHSEHQTGLSMDVGGGGCGIEDCFGKTAEGKWAAANAYKFGFIIRYPEGKEATTGYRYEPWHLRYVGKELATEMRKQKVQTLEEFFKL